MPKRVEQEIKVKLPDGRIFHAIGDPNDPEVQKNIKRLETEGLPPFMLKMMEEDGDMETLITTDEG